MRDSVDMGSYRDAISDKMGGADVHIAFHTNGLCGESENGFVGNERHFERSTGVCEQSLETCKVLNNGTVDSRSISVPNLLQKVDEARCLIENQKKVIHYADQLPEVFYHEAWKMYSI